MQTNSHFEKWYFVTVLWCKQLIFIGSLYIRDGIWYLSNELFGGFFPSLGEFCNILLQFDYLVVPPFCSKSTLMQLSILKSSLHSAWYMHYCGIDSKLFLFAWSSLFDQKWSEFGLYMLESKYYTGIFTIQMVFLNELTLMGQWDSMP